MTTTELARYHNGNCAVTLYSDGSKVREWPDGEDPQPEMPESVDLKITDYCDAMCPHCSEGCRDEGADAPIERIVAMLAGAQRGMEVAVGGGNPLEWMDTGDERPDLVLRVLSGMGLIPSVTVNARHAHMLASGDLSGWREHGWLYGIGLSYAAGWMPRAARMLLTPSTVVHVIAGVDPPGAIQECCGLGFGKFLVLGCKVAGRQRTMPDLEAWRAALPELFGLDITLSFDSLALEQLPVRELVGEGAWRRVYMGQDGQFTMYLDAVADTFAISSRHHRMPRFGRSLREMFTIVREEAAE